MMKTIAATLLVALALTGCSKTSEKGGVAGNDTFRIAVPAVTTSVKQGEVATVRISVERGAGFKHPVALVVKAPAGLQVEPSAITVQPSDPADVQLTVTAAPDAAIGDHTILVGGTPGKGEATETQFKVSVGAK